MNANTEQLRLNTKEQEAKIEEFIAAYVSGMEAWKKAGKLIVELVEDDPHVFDYIAQKCPSLTQGVLETFEKIGRGMLLPALAMDSSPGGRMLKNCPLSLQMRYEREPVPLIVETNDGTDVLLVKPRDMTRDQARQVFATGRIRSEGEQKAWLVDNRARKYVPNNPPAPWKIKGTKVEFQAGATMSAGELAVIISQLTK